MSQAHWKAACVAVDCMKLSVVIPYYRATATVAGQLEALSRQRWSESWEVIVSDNEGSDDLMEIAHSFKDRLRLRFVDSSDRLGAGHARNVGAQAATGESIAFCDADDEVGSGWLPAIGDALSKHDFVACRSDLTKLNPEWIQRAFKDDPQQYGLHRLEFPPYLPYAGGSSLGIKKSVHARVGGFDESWRVFQDVEYCLRVQLSGTELRYVPEALIHYRIRTTIPALFEQERRRGKSYVRLYKRYRTRDRDDPRSWKQEIDGLRLLLRTRSQAFTQSPADRAAWFAQLGWHIGLLQGSMRYSVSPPFRTDVPEPHPRG